MVYKKICFNFYITSNVKAIVIEGSVVFIAAI
jgi:hypothetical protein